MIAYLVLGTGVLLICGSVFYTYRVDRKVNTKEPVTDLNERIIRQVDSTQKPYTQMIKTAQVKESIGSIGEDLDFLIDELREKEAEVKQIVNKVKTWQSELSATVTPELNSQGNEELSTQTKVSNESNAKYEQISRLLDEGQSIEEIARKLNMGHREVELVAKIRKKEAMTSA